MTAVSRRGVNPKPDSKELSKVCFNSFGVFDFQYVGRFPSYCFLSACIMLMPLKFHRLLCKVTWVQGDATDMKTVAKALKDSDAAVHAIGMFLSQ